MIRSEVAAHKYAHWGSWSTLPIHSDLCAKRKPNPTDDITMDSSASPADNRNLSRKDSTRQADEALLASLGYKQEFKRAFTPLEVRTRRSCPVV